MEYIKRNKAKVFWICALLMCLSFPLILGADYAKPFVKAYKLYLNGTEVTSTAAELNMLDGLTGTVVTTNNTDAYVQIQLVDISTSDTEYITSPLTGYLTYAMLVEDGSLYDAGSDAEITIEIADTLVDDGSIPVTASGSISGRVLTKSFSSGNSITAGQKIEVITDGASSGATNKANVILKISKDNN